MHIRTFCNHLGIFKLGVSWGGYERLAMPALITLSRTDGPDSAIDFGVPERVVRLQIGLERADALSGILNAALAAAA